MQVTVSLAYALQWKAKTVVPQMSATWAEFQRENSLEKPEGHEPTREGDPTAAFDLGMKLGEYLCRLNKQLDEASGESRRMAIEKRELIALKNQLDHAPTTHGIFAQRGYDDKRHTVEYVAIKKKADIEPVAKDLQRRINRLQMAIDARNASTMVTLDVPDYVEPPEV
jgi:hypothetical protein